MKAGSLSKEAKNLHRLFDGISDASLLMKDGVYVACNEAAVRLSGYPTKESILNSSPADHSPTLQPDGRKSSEKAEEMIALAFQNGSHRFKWDRQQFSRSIVNIDVTLTPIELGGENFLHVLWQDFSGQAAKHREESMGQFIENMGDAHFVLKNGLYTECNQAAVDLLGYPNKESLLNLDRNKFYPPLQPDGADSFVKGLEVIELARQNGTHSCDWTYLKFDGTPIHTALMMAMSVVRWQRDSTHCIARPD